MKEQRTRNNIIKKARSLFSKSSFDAVSMNDIAGELSITKAALYYHFASKDKIYEAVLEDFYQSLFSIIEKTQMLDGDSPEQRLQCFLQNYCDFCLKEKKMLKDVITKTSTDRRHFRKTIEKIIALRKRFTDMAVPLIEEALENTGVKKKVKSRIYTSLVLGAINGMVLDLWIEGNRVDSEELSKEVLKAMF